MSIVGVVELRIRDDDGDDLDVLGGYAGTRQRTVQQKNTSGDRGLCHLHIFQLISHEQSYWLGRNSLRCKEAGLNIHPRIDTGAEIEVEVVLWQHDAAG